MKSFCLSSPEYRECWDYFQLVNIVCASIEYQPPVIVLFICSFPWSSTILFNTDSLLFQPINWKKNNKTIFYYWSTFLLLIMMRMTMIQPGVTSPSIVASQIETALSVFQSLKLLRKVCWGPFNNNGTIFHLTFDTRERSLSQPPQCLNLNLKYNLVC